MPEFASDRTTQKQIQKVALAENRFEVASENVQDQHVSQEMPRTAIEQRGGDELPCVSIVNTAIT